MRIMPSPILYQPKLSKLCFLTNAIKNLIAIIDTAKAVSVPTSITIISVISRERPSIKKAFAHFKRDAPSITGIAKKKENSAAAVLDTLTKEAPRMVEPERDVPGISDKT